MRIPVPLIVVCALGLAVALHRLGGRGPAPVSIGEAAAPPAAAPAAAAAQEGSHVGARLPDVTLETQDGVKASLTALRGGKPALVYFFATCCGHCQGELKKFSPLAREVHGRGAAVFGVQYYGSKAMCEFKINEYSLAGTVFADADGAVCGRFGVGDFTVMTLGVDGVVTYRGGLDPEAVKKGLGVS